MSKLNKRGNIRSLESVTRHRMGRMDKLSNACEGDKKSLPQTFEMGVVVLVNGYKKPITIDLLALYFLRFEP